MPCPGAVYVFMSLDMVGEQMNKSCSSLALDRHQVSGGGEGE